MKFVPVGAVQGVNLANREGDEATELRQWYKGPTLVDCLGEPSITYPVMSPIANCGSCR